MLISPDVSAGYKCHFRNPQIPKGWRSPQCRECTESGSNRTPFFSTITILELEKGVVALGRRDPKQADILRSWLENDVMKGFGNRILPVDIPVARQCAALHVPVPRPYADALIGATARVHGLTLVTRNVADFAGMGVPILDPWSGPAAG